MVSPCEGEALFDIKRYVRSDEEVVKPFAEFD
jgi:hypothetical protein